MNLDLNLHPKSWLGTKKGPFIIAGPCSAESEEQVFKTVLPLKNLNVDFIRAGIWKPRTRPDSFQGVGSFGLKWLKDACLEIGKPCMIEVANPRHIDEALKAGIDMVWIGARTTVNPFAVQEIADALVGVDIPVFIKNPINPDLELWLGAIERINRAGIQKIGVIHRGFSTGKKMEYRNDPHWEIPIELKRLIPEIPMICDPSHITGNRKLVNQVAQKALNMDYDGLMMEVHCQPDKALSDAAQQIDIQNFTKLLDNLIFPINESIDEISNQQIDLIRQQIDSIDFEIIALLEKRMQNAKQLGNVKSKTGITILQKKRWQRIVESRMAFGAEKNISEDFILKIWQLIHVESIELQQKVFEELRKLNSLK